MLKFIRIVFDFYFIEFLFNKIKRNFIQSYSTYLNKKKEYHKKYNTKYSDYYNEFNSENLLIDETVSIGKDSIILMPNYLNSNARIEIRKNAWINRYVELQTWESNKLIIKDYATINDFCKILGSVTIEKYCVFSCNIYISSGNHYATLKPTWLIRDQDNIVREDSFLSKEHISPVHIEEDCWIGWGVFVKRGIYIGRGAVVGAYTVVTKDIPPYSIQTGIPNKEQKKRFDFDPPEEILAIQEDHRPYFYRGFAHKQFELTLSLEENIILCENESILVLKGGSFSRLFIEGKLGNGVKKFSFGLYYNGDYIKIVTVDVPCFSLEVQLTEGSVEVENNSEYTNFPDFMKQYNIIEIKAIDIKNNLNYLPNDNAYSFGFSRIKIA